jgi:hypothetical protein
MALAASAWVTTEQELKLAVPAVVVVVATVVDELEATVVAADAVVVLVVLDGVGEDEPHAANTTAAGRASTTPTLRTRSLA